MWILPEMGSYSRNASLISVDFPDPVVPASPTVSPFERVKLSFFSMGTLFS